LTADKKNLRRLLLVSLEVEFEWIRQFYIQGQKHYDLHVWWHKPMHELLDLFVTIEKRLVRIVTALADSVGVHVEDDKQDGEVTTGLPQTSGNKSQKKLKILSATVEADSFEELRLHLQDVSIFFHLLLLLHFDNM